MRVRGGGGQCMREGFPAFSTAWRAQPSPQPGERPGGVAGGPAQAGPAAGRRLWRAGHARQEHDSAAAQDPALSAPSAGAMGRRPYFPSWMSSSALLAPRSRSHATHLRLLRPPAVYVHRRPSAGAEAAVRGGVRAPSSNDAMTPPEDNGDTADDTPSVAAAPRVADTHLLPLWPHTARWCYVEGLLSIIHRRCRQHAASQSVSIYWRHCGAKLCVKARHAWLHVGAALSSTPRC